MKNFKYILIALSFMSLSCERQEIMPEPKQFASFRSDAENPFNWKVNDEIKVSDGLSETLFKTKGSGSSAIFQAEGMMLNTTADYIAAYPKDLASFADDVLTVQVKASHSCDPGDFPSAPSVAISNGADCHFEFHNVYGLVSFKIKSENVASVTVEGRNNEVLAGYVKVDPRTGVYDTTGILNPVTSVEIKGPLTKMAPGQYFIPVLPQAFENGLVLKLHLVGSTDIIERVIETVELTRSGKYDAGELDGQYFKYNIRTARELQDFLTDAEFCESYVEATLMNDINLRDFTLVPAKSYAGKFDGNGKVLKNWHTSAPLFAHLTESGRVNNLIIEMSCYYELSQTDNPQAFVVGLNEGAVLSCENRGTITCDYASASDGAKWIVGGLVGESRSLLQGCTNSGKINLNVSAQSTGLYVGGVVGLSNNVSNPLEECTNSGDISIIASVEVASSVGGVVGSVEQGTIINSVNTANVSVKGVSGLNIGGVVGKAGTEGGNADYSVTNCKNAGTVLAEESGTAVLNIGGIVGWTNYILEGSSAKNLLNQGLVSVKNAVGTSNVGGVVGQSMSKYSKIYNTGEVSVALSDKATGVRVGGVAGYLSGSQLAAFVDNDKQPNHLVTGQNEGNVYVSGGTTVTDPVYVGGVIGLSDVRNMSHNQTSWDLCNSNMGNITVNCPVTVVVGGAIACELGKDMTVSNYGGRRAVSGAKNRGDIIVTNPGKESYVGGLVGWHGRGMIGNANNVGRYDPKDSSKWDKITISVTGADTTTCVGAVVGYLSSNNGTAWGCSTVISGCGIYCDISATGATAALIVGKANFKGSSAAPGFMLGSSSGERPKYHVDCLLNGTAVGALTDDLQISKYFAVIQKDGRDVTPEFRTGFAGGALSTPKTCLQTY